MIENTMKKYVLALVWFLLQLLLENFAILPG